MSILTSNDHSIEDKPKPNDRLFGQRVLVSKHPSRPAPFCRPWLTMPFASLFEDQRQRSPHAAGFGSSKPARCDVQRTAAVLRHPASPIARPFQYRRKRLYDRRVDKASRICAHKLSSMASLQIIEKPNVDGADLHLGGILTLCVFSFTAVPRWIRSRSGTRKPSRPISNFPATGPTHGAAGCRR